MTETDYIKVVNITSLRAAAAALREVMPVDGDLSEDEIRAIAAPLQQLIQKQQELIETT